MSGGFHIDDETRDRQARASDPQRSAWVTANAGSGKTHVLTQRVLRLLLGGADPGAVLCLTFTKAAAAQMQAKVFEELARWTQADAAALEQTLRGLLARLPSKEETQLARRLFARAIETPGRLKIQTIHAFCESVLQRFPFEARVPAGFTVIEDDLAAALKLQARREALAAPEDEALAAALARLSLALDARSFADLLGRLVDRRNDFTAWTDRDGRFSAAAARAHLAGTLGITDRRSREDIRAEILNGPHLPRGEWAAIADALAQCRKAGTGNTVDQLRAAASAGDDEAALEAYLLVFLTQKNAPRKSLFTKDEKAGEPDLCARIEAEAARLPALCDAYRAAGLLDLNADLAHAADAVISRYEQLKSERAVLDYADLIARAVELLEFGENASWVLYKLDPGLDHVLVDEAQDTSPEQWRVVQALTGEFFAGEGARVKERTVFAVGDPKQSIYSFNGADPAGFLAMAGRFGRQAAERGGFDTVPLYLSFRTAPAVLEAVDAVFAGDTAQRGVVFAGAGIAHTSARPAARGRVELWDALPQPEAPAPEPWTAPLDTRRSDSAETLLARAIARDIRASIARGDILPATGRQAQAGDFLILLRKRPRLAAPILRALKNEGIAVAGADRLQLANSIATLDLMALMRAGLMPDDDYALACALKSPLLALNDEHLMALAIDRPGSLADALAAHRGDSAIEAAAARFAALAHMIRNARPFTFLAHVLGPGGGRKAYRRRLGNEADDVLDEIADRALAFERANVPTVAGFLAWLERSGTEIKRDLDEGGGAVRVMTVHGAKGLEAPVVYLADTCTPPKSSRTEPLLSLRGEDIFAPPRAALWDAGKAFRTESLQALVEERDRRAEEEFHRLLYVAMTRAKDRLVVCGAETGNGRGTGCWYDLVETALAPRLEEEAEGVRVFMPEVAGEAPQALALQEPAPASEPLPAWAGQTFNASPAPDTRAASGLGAPARGHGSGGSQARRRGTLVHLLLEHLPDLAEEKRGPAADALIAAHARDMEQRDRERLRDSVLALIADPALAFLFAPGSRAEVPVAGTVLRRDDGQSLSITGRIDRLAVEAKRVTIADYKTGGRVPTSGQDIPSAYVAQLAAYAALLGVIHPQKSIEAVLIWTDAPDGPAATHIPAGMLTGFAPSAH